jgi:light-regulated signal transduction histidine kinase (bacteriophytochrome)
MDLKTADPETRIRELTEELEALSYSISHDLRAPLRAVTGFSQILLRNHSDRLDPEGRELLQMVHDGAKTLNGMIEALLVYSRIERRVMVFSELNMGELADGGEICCQVKDNGVGFDPDYSDRLFSMFQRLHPAEQFEGIGSGLAIARRIVRRHGGRIWAESQPGAGAAFYFILG